VACPAIASGDGGCQLVRITGLASAQLPSSNAFVLIGILHRGLGRSHFVRYTPSVHSRAGLTPDATAQRLYDTLSPSRIHASAWLIVDVKTRIASLLMSIVIRVDDLTGPEIAAFLEEHIRDMRAVSPPESKHALDLEGVRKPEITFWTAWSSNRLIGCCALKKLDTNHGEVKSMRVASDQRAKGIGSLLVAHVIGEARARGYGRLSLETGAMPFFEPARRLYWRHGFEQCGPFAPYKPDPNSVFMTLKL